MVLPILRQAVSTASVGTWLPDADHRELPYILIRRVGGARHDTRPNALAFPTILMAAYSNLDLADAESLYDWALDALYASVRDQTVVPDIGYLSSIRETVGASQTPSLIPDTWAVSGQIQLGLRPVKACTEV